MKKETFEDAWFCKGGEEGRWRKGVDRREIY